MSITFDETAHPRAASGEFATKEHSAPSGALDLEDDVLFVAEVGSATYEVTHEGGSSYSAYRGGAFVLNFYTAGDPEDHDSIDDALRSALDIG